jgi:hypothetical protein
MRTGRFGNRAFRIDQQGCNGIVTGVHSMSEGVERFLPAAAAHQFPAP